MKNLLVAAFLLLLTSAVKSQVQRILYTPMTAAGYQFKYGKFDSGLNVPNVDTSTFRGTRRPGSIVIDTLTGIFYGWDGIRWRHFSHTTGGGTFTGIDSVTYSNNFICQWKNGASTCYPVIPGVDSVTVANDTLCQWKAGVPTCYPIDGNVLGVFVDSVVVGGNQLCQWIAGTSTCYTINTLSTSIDSITIINNNFCIYIGGVASCITLQPDTVYVRTPDLGVYWDSTGHQVIFETQDDGRIWGGIVTGGTNCMDIDITPTYYYLDGVAYLSAQTTLTISASDPTLNRYDLIVVDTFGVVAVIVGGSAANPVIPQHNPGSQIPLTSIYVPAGATCLPIAKSMIYNENIEYTTGSTGTITVDYNNTANPHALTKAAYVSAYDFGASLTFTKPSGQDTIRAGSILKFWIYLNKAFTGSLQVQFYLGSTPVSSRQAVAATDGFMPLDTTQYRNISMIVGNWQTPPTIWDKLVIYPSGQDLSGAGGFYLDEIQVQTGLTPQSKAYVDSVNRIGDSIYYWKQGTPFFASAVGSGGGGSGTVTSVTGSAPIIITSTPTTTPNVTADTSKTGGRLATYSDVTFDQALRRGNQTRQKAVWNDSVAVATTGITFSEFIPRNYNTSYTTGTQSSFQQGYGYYPGVNADGRPNVVGLFWGYNGGFNVPAIAGEATWGFRTENWYQSGGRNLSEFHLPEFKGIDGVSRRPASFYIDNTNSFTTYNQQIDAYNGLMGATDTIMFNYSRTGASFGWAQNAGLTLRNQRIPTNQMDITVVDNGAQLTLAGGVTPSLSYFQIGAPALFATHATIGTTLASAIEAIVGTANFSAFRIAQTGLSTSNFRGIWANDVNTTGIFSLFNAHNVGTSGQVEGYLGTSNGGTARYVLANEAGSYWQMRHKSATVEKSLFIGNSASDTTFKIRGDTRNIYLRNSVSIGTADPTARLLLPAGTTAASTAPLKFTSGPLTTTPEIGAIHFENGLAYLDSSNSIRDTIATRRWARNSITGGGGGTTLPDQTGNAGKYLKTDGAALSWDTPAGAGDLLANGTTPLTANWNVGAFNIETNQTAATGNTFYDGLKLSNTTTASSGNQMISPVLKFRGSGWKTTATAASQSTEVRIYAQPVQGTTAPANTLVFDGAVNGAAFTQPITFNFSTNTQTLGNVFLGGTLTASAAVSFSGILTSTSAGAAGVFDRYIQSNTTAATSGVPQQYSAAIHQIGTAWTGAASQVADYRFYVHPINGTNPITSKWVLQSQVNALGYVDVLSVFNNGRVTLSNVVNLKTYTVATLPAGTVGDMAYVTDATAPTYLGALTGGGAVVCPVFYNGTIWVSH